MAELDFDFVVVGSGFGGSVSALRLVEKGYRVAVLEMGKRWNAEDFPRTNWDLRRFLWLPRAGLYGILQMTLLRDVFFLHGAGVGGGSLVYANTLLQPLPAAFEDERWVELDWKEALAPHYETAKRMLGATRSPFIVESDRLLRSVAEDMGRGDTFHRYTVGVYFGESGKTVEDPFFGGEGPARTGCNRCGGCMVGCRHGAKNTLDKNYLYLAEKRGCRIIPETRATDIRPLEGGGYRITAERSTGLFHPKRTFTTRGVVLSAGSFGTVELLMRCRERGSLPKISAQLGNFVRTNSEALLAVRSRKKDVDHSKGIAITSGALVDESTHIEAVRYSKGSDAMATLTTLLTDDGPGVPRWLRWIGNLVRHPIEAAKLISPFGWAKRSVILLVMQPVSSYLRYVLKRRWYWPFSRAVDTEPADGQKVPVYIPVANEVARRLAEKMDGVPQSGLVEVTLNRATTAHILGGCPIGASPDDGVVDTRCRLFGYDDFYVADGSIIPANLGVNPSLTITAMAEHTMSHVPAKPGASQPALAPLPALDAGAAARDEAD